MKISKARPMGANLRAQEAPQDLDALKAATAEPQGRRKAYLDLVRELLRRNLEAEVLAALAEARSHDAVTPELGRLFLQAVQTRKLKDERAAYEAFLGTSPETLAEGAALLPRRLFPLSKANQILKLVTAVVGKPPADPGSWKDRLDEGYRLSLMARYFSNALMKPLRQLPLAERKAFMQKTKTLRPAAGNIEELKQLIAAGKSVVILRTHAGAGFNPLALLKPWLDEKSIPRSIVGNAASGDFTSSDFNISPLAEDFPFQFTRLCKLMKKGQRVCMLFPDGTKGGSFGEIKVGPLRLPVGLGAAQLAYFGKATFCFASTVFRDGQPELEFWFGPSVEDGMTSDDAARLMTTFYESCITRILTGDPLNFNPIGGYWPALTKDVTE